MIKSFLPRFFCETVTETIPSIHDQRHPRQIYFNNTVPFPYIINTASPEGPKDAGWTASQQKTRTFIQQQLPHPRSSLQQHHHQQQQFPSSTQQLVQQQHPRHHRHLSQQHHEHPHQRQRRIPSMVVSPLVSSHLHPAGGEYIDNEAIRRAIAASRRLSAMVPRYRISKASITRDAATPTSHLKPLQPKPADGLSSHHMSVKRKVSLFRHHFPNTDLPNNEVLSPSHARMRRLSKKMNRKKISRTTDVATALKVSEDKDIG